MSEIELPDGSCTFTANVIGTQLLLSVPDSSQQSGDTAVVRYIPVYIEGGESDVVSSYVINDSQLPLLNQTRQIILTEDQIVTLDQVSASDLEQSGCSSQIVTLNSEESQEPPSKFVPCGIEAGQKTAAVLLQEDDVTLAEGTISVNPVYPPVGDDVVDPPDRTCPEVCDVCGLRFESRKLFRKHILSHLHDKPFKCPHCPESFNHEYNYIPHVATHNEKDPYCPVCNKRFSRLAGLKAHILIHQCDDTLPCPECLEEFSTHKLLEAHRLEHKSGFVKQPTRMHHCSNCDEKFATKAFLKEHVLEVHKLKMPKKVKRGKGGYVCEYCKKRFEKPSQLVRHKRTHTGEKPFKCAECGKGFGQKGSLQIHMLKHSGLKPYACKYCSSQFSQKGNLQAHIQRIHPDEKDEVRKLHCKHCSCVFRNIVSLHSHMSRNHGIYFTNKKGKAIAYEIRRQGDTLTADVISPDTDSSNKENESKGDESDGKATDSDATSQKAENDPEWKNKSSDVINKCKHCSKVFKKRADLVKHLKVHSEESVKSEFLCGVCGRHFLTETVFQTHLETAHPEMLEFSCDLCPSKFAVLEDLKIHRRSAHEEQYKCRTCNAVFESADFKQLHEAQHVVEVAEPEPPEAPIPETSAVIYREDALLECTKVIISPDGTIKLVRDNEVEEAPTPMVTDACIETEPEVLAQEVIEEPTREVEDESRKFKCDHCNQSFKKISHYKAHLRIHTGEKPFSCEKCHKLFAAKSALTIHMGSHDEVPSFACDDCGKTFSSHRSLKRHMELHAPGFPYTCTVCSRAYKTKVAWQKHVSTHLKIPEQQDSSNKVDEVCQNAQTLVNDAQLIEIIQQKTPVEDVAITENKKDSASSAGNCSFQGDWNDLIQSLQPGQQFSFNGSQTYTTVAASSSPVKTTTCSASQKTSSPVRAQFDGFGEKNSLFTPLNDQAFDGCVFLQSSDNLQTGNQTLPVAVPTEVPAQPQVNTHRCSLCNVSFDNLVELSIHKTTHLQEKWATCPTCNKTFSSSQEYQAHTKDCPPAASSPPPAPTQSEYTVCFDFLSSDLQKCISCNIHFFQMSDYTAHVASVHGASACKFCSVWFKTDDQLQAHQLSHTQANKSELKQTKPELRIKVETAPALQPSTAKVSVATVEVEPVVDSGERKPGTSREKLELKRKRAAWRRQAVRTLTEEEQLAIAKENPSSISERILQQSILRLKKSPKREDTERDQEHPNKCKYCPKSFRKPSDLVRHLRVHTGERPYTCTSCNKSFSIKSTAKSHVKIHKKERAYKCHICDNSFAAVGSLKVHMRLHTGAKPFACELCPAKFRTSGHRKSHMFSHMRKDVAKEKEERERAFLAGSDSLPPMKSENSPNTPPPLANFLNKLPDPQEDRPEDLLDKIVPEKDHLSDTLEQLKKPLSNNQFLFPLDGPLGFGDRAGESSGTGPQFFLKEVKGDDQAGTAAHFVVTMDVGDDITYPENINYVLESVPALSEEQDKFDLDLDLPEEQLNVRECTDRGKVFSSCLDLESHMKKEHFIGSSLSCNVCKLTFTAKTDLELHTLVHDFDHLSCHVCSQSFPNEIALRKHKCPNEDSNLKAMPSAPLDLASVVNEFFSFPSL